MSIMIIFVVGTFVVLTIGACLFTWLVTKVFYEKKMLKNVVTVGKTLVNDEAYRKEWIQKIEETEKAFPGCYS